MSSRAVLIVEDDDAIRTSLAEFLEGTGFTVHSAGHGADALELLKTIDPPAVIVLDLDDAGHERERISGGDAQ